MIYKLNIIDEHNESHLLTFHNREYSSLMELLRDRLNSDIGDCRGRMWCNTCAVKLCHKEVEVNLLKIDEIRLLEVIPVDNIRLSCQLELTKVLNGTTWRILDSWRWF